MGITPSSPEYTPRGPKVLQFSIFLFGGSISFIILIIILILQLKKNEKGIISRALKLITISEIINCIPKIINSFKTDKEKFKPSKKDPNTSTICYIQFIIQNCVDIITPLLSLIISREIYYLIDMNELSCIGENQLITLISSIVIPFIITLILFYLQYNRWNYLTDYDRIKNRDYVCYGSVNSTFIMIIIIILLVSFSIYYSIKSSIILYQKKNEFIEIEEELITNNGNENSDSEINEHPTTDKISAKLDKMYKKNLRYPFLFSVIWFIFILCRGIDIYDYKKNQTMKNEALRIFFVILNFLMSVRGLCYCVAFFSINDLCHNNTKKTVNNKDLVDNNDTNNNEINIVSLNELNKESINS